MFRMKIKMPGNKVRKRGEDKQFDEKHFKNSDIMHLKWKTCLFGSASIPALSAHLNFWPTPASVGQVIEKYLGVFIHTPPSFLLLLSPRLILLSCWHCYIIMCIDWMVFVVFEKAVTSTQCWMLSIAHPWIATRCWKIKPCFLCSFRIYSNIVCAALEGQDMKGKACCTPL